MSEQQRTASFDEWCLVELMGHNVLAGRVSEATVGGASLIRVDVPSVDEIPGFTKYFGASAIYAISPTTKATVEALVKRQRPKPIQLYLPSALSARDEDGDF